MERMQDVIKMASAAAAGLCTVLWGGADAWLMALLLFLLLDYCSGVAAAIVRCELSSRTGFRGLLKKLLVLLIAAIASRLDALLGAGATTADEGVGPAVQRIAPGFGRRSKGGKP